MNWRHAPSICVNCLTWWSLYDCVTSTGAALQPGAIWTEDMHPQSVSTVWHGDHYMTVLHQQEQHYNLVQYELKTRTVNLCQLSDMVIIIWLCYINRSSITTWCNMNWRHAPSTCVNCLTWWSLYDCVTSTGAALQPGAIWTEDTHRQPVSTVWHGDHYMTVLHQQEQHYNLVQYELKTRTVNLCQLSDMVIIIWLCYINRSSITTWCNMNWRHAPSTCVSCLSSWSKHSEICTLRITLCRRTPLTM